MNKNIINKVALFSMYISFVTHTQPISTTENEYIFPKTVTFLNNTEETLEIYSHSNKETIQTIAPQESFLLSDDKPEIHWKVPQDIEAGVYIRSAIFTLKGNILEIEENYAENPQGSKPLFQKFKKLINLTSKSENFEIFKNGRILDINEKT